MIIKRRLLITTLSCGLLMVYFYWHHNTYCRPYVYSLFCISEYVIVLCNMGFHMTAYYELYNADVGITSLAAGGGGGGGQGSLCV